MEWTRGIAKYRQIAESVRQQIERGKLKPGDQLPSRAEMARRYGVQEMTVRQATQLLAEWGLTETKHGSGTFVIRKG